MNDVHHTYSLPFLNEHSTAGLILGSTKHLVLHRLPIVLVPKDAPTLTKRCGACSIKAVGLIVESDCDGVFVGE